MGSQVSDSSAICSDLPLHFSFSLFLLPSRRASSTRRLLEELVLEIAPGAASLPVELPTLLQQPAAPTPTFPGQFLGRPPLRPSPAPNATPSLAPLATSWAAD